MNGDHGNENSCFEVFLALPQFSHLNIKHESFIRIGVALRDTIPIAVLAFDAPFMIRSDMPATPCGNGSIAVLAFDVPVIG